MQKHRRIKTNMPDSVSNNVEQVRAGHTAEVTIQVGPLYAVLPASVTEHIRPLLTVARTEYVESDDGKLAARTDALACYHENKQGQLVIPAGLVPRAVKHLDARGYTTRVVQTVNWAAAVDHSLLASLAASPWHERLISAFANNLRRQLVYHFDEDRLEILNTILRVFPQRGILIAAKDRKTCRTLQKQLAKRSCRKVFDNVDDAWHSRPATLVATTYVAKQIAHTDDFQLIVLADHQTAASVASYASQAQLWELPDMRVFAILASDNHLDSLQRFELEARLGPVIPDSVPCAYLPEVTVCSVGPFSYPPPDKSLNHLERKRLYVWHNRVRNVQVARIATACVACDQTILREYGWQGEETLVSSTQEEQQYIPPSVAVLVESPEHARAIRKLLPDWDLLEGRGGDGANKANTPLRPDKAIITWTRACRDGLAVDVLLRADGTGARHQDSLGPDIWLNRCPMKVIDFMDDFDEQAKNDSISRHREYAERDFAIAGTERR